MFWGALTDISARKTPLVETHRLDDGSDGSIDSFVSRVDLIDAVSEHSSAPRSFINVRALYGTQQLVFKTKLNDFRIPSSKLK